MYLCHLEECQSPLTFQIEQLQWIKCQAQFRIYTILRLKLLATGGQ